VLLENSVLICFQAPTPGTTTHLEHDRGARNDVGAVESSSEAVVSPTVEEGTLVPWWEQFADEDVVALDCEFVIKMDKSVAKQFQQQAASVDIVRFDGSSLFSTRVYHEPGTFQDNAIWRKLTGFNQFSFNDPTLPTLEKTRQTVLSLLQGKLVITVGGGGDFNSLGLKMKDNGFNCFDLQSHFFVRKINEYGDDIREPHSLRSLAKHYLGYNPQELAHTSYEDAVATMDLFKIYKRVKLEDDPGNVGEEFNVTISYNHIPVIRSSLKKK
jgi:hypothetical protein